MNAHTVEKEKLDVPEIELLNPTAANLPATISAPGSVAKIVAAIAGVMKKVGVVAKDGTNQFHRYQYAKMEDVLRRITPLMAEHELVVIQTEVGREMFDNDRAIAVQYAFTLCHSSGEVWPDRPIQTGLARCRDSKGGFDDKALNKAHTAARKYFLLALFQIPTGDEPIEDTDRGDNDGPVRPAPAFRPSPSRSPDTPDDTPPEHRSNWNEKSLTQQAGILCEDVSFWAFLTENETDGEVVDTPGRATLVVRRLCGVSSRADIKPGTPAGKIWHGIVQDYRLWQRNPDLSLPPQVTANASAPQAAPPSQGADANIPTWEQYCERWDVIVSAAVDAKQLHTEWDAQKDLRRQIEWHGDEALAALDGLKISVGSAITRLRS